jgi:hypothetical protein
MQIPRSQQDDSSRERHAKRGEVKAAALRQGWDPQQGCQQKPAQCRSDDPNYDIEDDTLLGVCPHDHARYPPNDATDNQEHQDIHAHSPFLLRYGFTLIN